MAVAESCTGGLMAARLSERPGASEYLVGGVVSYADEAKVEQLGVDAALIERHGAVSPEVADAMALGALERFGADTAIAITGIAGPGRRQRGEAGGHRLLVRAAGRRRRARAQHPHARRPCRDPRPLDHRGHAHAPPAAAGRGPAGLSARPDDSERPWRLFLALDIPDLARSALARWRDAAVMDRDELRPVPEAQLHVTLVFLGATAPGRVDAFWQAASGAADGLGALSLAPARGEGRAAAPDAPVRAGPA